MIKNIKVAGRIISTCILVISLSSTFYDLHAENLNVTPGADADCSDLNCDLQSALTFAGHNNEEDTIHITEGEYSVSDLLPIDGSIGFLYQPVDAENFGLNLMGDGVEKTILNGSSSENGRAIVRFVLNSSISSHFSIKGISFVNGVSSTASGLAGFAIEMNNSTLEVDSCLFENNVEGFLASVNRFGDDLNAGSVSIHNSTFTKNLSRGGLNVSTDGNVSVHSNIIRSNHTDAGGSGTELISSGTSQILVVNNIIEGNSGGAAGIFVDANTANSIDLINNTIVSNDKDGAAIFSPGDSADTLLLNNVIRNNEVDIYFDGGIGGSGGAIRLVSNNFNNIQTACIECSVRKEESSNINLDPLFIDPTNGDFRLGKNSPCIDAGTSDGITLPTLDFEGETRVMGASVDIGADEFNPDAGLGDGAPLPDNGGGSGSSGSSGGGCSLIR